MNIYHHVDRVSAFARLALILCCLGMVLLCCAPAPGQSAGAPTPRQLYEKAEASYATIDSYISRLVRHNPAANGKTTEEILILYFRKHPWSVRFKWLAGPGRGREVLYVKGRHENKIHVVTAPGDIPLLPGGQKMALSLDSPLVTRASKTPITESGIGAFIERFGRSVVASEHGNTSTDQLTVRGEQQRPDYDVPLIMVEEKVPPNGDEDIPRGGRRLIGFHSQLHLPVLCILHNEVGQEVSYFRFDRLELNVHLTDADFDPANMGPPPAKPGPAKSAASAVIWKRCRGIALAARGDPCSEIADRARVAPEVLEILMKNPFDNLVQSGNVPVLFLRRSRASCSWTPA